MNSVKEEERSVRELWMKRIEDGEKHPGGVRGFCMDTQITAARFYYWRNKLKPKAQSAPAEPAVENFIVAEIAEPCERPKPSLPDPKWLAAFAVELIRGLSR
jgi:hypothetical protein